MVIYKMGGTESQYDPKLTRLPVLYEYDGSRDGWKAGDPKLIGDSTSVHLYAEYQLQAYAPELDSACSAPACAAAPARENNMYFRLSLS
jgi:hypothetical protein